MLVCTVSLHRNLSLWRVIPNASRIPKADSMNKEKNIKVINFITFYKFLITVAYAMLYLQYSNGIQGDYV